MRFVEELLCERCSGHCSRDNTADVLGFYVSTVNNFLCPQHATMLQSLRAMNDYCTTLDIVVDPENRSSEESFGTSLSFYKEGHIYSNFA